MNTCLKDHGPQSQEGGQSRQKDRAKASLGGKLDGFDGRSAFRDKLQAGELQHKGPVDHHATERNHAENAEDAQVKSHDDVADDGAGKAPRKHEQYDQGLDIASQNGCHDAINGK